MIEKALQRHKVKFSEKAFTLAVPRLGHKNADDALAAVGRGELASTDVLKAMGIAVDEGDIRAAKRRVAKPHPKEAAHAIPVRGAGAGLALKYHLRTGAVPGERIVGIVTPGEGITIYPIFAEALEQFDAQPARWVDLAWGATEEGQRFPARIKITLVNEVGALAQVTQAIGDKGGNIDELSMHAQGGVRDFFDLDVLLEVFDIRHLNSIITEIQAKSSTTSVRRATG
jgi:(p)ppGpp synthase/HD superfamily hydrolase